MTHVFGPRRRFISRSSFSILALATFATWTRGQTIAVPNGQIGTTQNGTTHVGIGTSSPAAKLEIAAGTSNGLLISTANAGPWGLIIKNQTYSGGGFSFYQDNDGSGSLFSNYPAGSRLWMGANGNVALNPAGNGGVGIGTATPEDKLHVMGRAIFQGGQSAIVHRNSAGSTVALTGVRNDVAGENNFTFYGYGANWIFHNGYVGIGTPAPQSPLHVKGGFGAIRIDTQGNGITYGDMLFYEGTTRIAGIRAHKPSTSNVPGLLEVWSDAGNINFSGGNVGIGTHLPTHRLSVNGSIKAKEVIVETAGWSDHVFEDDYKLASLEEVETHI